MAQSAGAAEYTDCISAERKNSLNKHTGYDTKQSDGEADSVFYSPSRLDKQLTCDKVLESTYYNESGHEDQDKLKTTR